MKNKYFRFCKIYSYSTEQLTLLLWHVCWLSKWILSFTVCSCISCALWFQRAKNVFSIDLLRFWSYNFLSKHVCTCLDLLRWSWCLRLHEFWLVTLKLIIEANLGNWLRHILLFIDVRLDWGLSKWILGVDCWILSENFFALFFLQEFSDSICHVRYFHLFTHFFNDFEWLAKVEHVHILEDAFWLIFHHWNSNRFN